VTGSAPAGSAATVVRPVRSASLAAAGSGRGTLLGALDEQPDALVYFLLNVGDGDSQVLLLPPGSSHAERRVVVVDVATRHKVPELLIALHQAGLLPRPGTAGQVALLVATHPHFDHIGGMGQLVEVLGQGSGCVDQFWDPGFYSPNPSFHDLMRRLEDDPRIRRLQPTSGTTLFLDCVRLTVLGPGVALRMRFDTYGVQVNDASLTLMVEFPATRLYAEPAQDRPGEVNRRLTARRSRRLLLGADAQFTSWAQTTSDFPDLHDHGNPLLQKELRTAVGQDPLRADVFKLSHHASKNGVNVELLARVNARTTLVSSSAGGGRYNFPHLLAMEAAREAVQATTQSGAARHDDDALGIHVTGSILDTGEPVGSVALLLPRGSRPVRLFRLMDGPADPVDLTRAREAVPPP